MASSGSILGNPVLRKEDPGSSPATRSTSTTSQIDGLLHVAFVRSTIAHARIESIDTSDAKAMPGVVAVYTAGDLDLPDHHGFVMLPPTMNRPPLAQEKVRFVGDIVAMVVAEIEGAGGRRGRGRDRRLRPAARRSSTWRPRSTPTPPLSTRSTARTSPTRWAPVRSKACSTTPTSSSRQRIVNQRARRRCRWSRTASSRCPGEPVGGLTFWVVVAGSARRARRARDDARARSRASCAARSAAVGGGFGAKQGVYVEYFLVAKAALVLDRR